MKANILSLGLAAGLAAQAFAGDINKQNINDLVSYVAHEWGTFTSVQDAHGNLQIWRPLESSHLPGFVYDRVHNAPNISYAGKDAMFTYQRMETPVIYFYARQPQTVDVSVSFPKGTVTEWYPQVNEIGPFYVDKSAAKRTAEDALAAKPAPVSDSRIHWSNVQILPDEPGARQLPFDKSGSHYFSARATDSNELKIKTPSNSSQFEKFLFYRGVGNFETPLRVTMENANTITLSNNGKEALDHLFILNLRDRHGGYVYVEQLGAGEKRIVQLVCGDASAAVESVSKRLSTQMAASLVREGLYEKEAAAMVQTWKDSWFEEDGVRVLYVLSRAWTDGVLPITVQPAPRELVRVMVGRAEVLPQALEDKLAKNIREAGEGTVAAKEDLQAELRRLGRFADPALRLALHGASQEVNERAWSFYNAAFQARN